MDSKSGAPHVLLLDLRLLMHVQVMSVLSNEQGRVRTSSSGVKSLTMLKSLRISSGVLPLIMFATVLQPTSLRHRQHICSEDHEARAYSSGLMSR
jgi:hypothetical protein